MHAKDTFGIRLIKAQNRAGLKNYQVCEKIDVNSSTYSNWRSSAIGISVPSLIRLCGALNCSADFLLGLSDKPEIK